MKRAAVLALAACMACGGGPQAPAANPIEGLIVEIDGTSMRLDAEGATATFEIGDESVPIEHLHEHREMRLPVLVTWERRGDALVATRIADA